jgi:hypothetical protein
MSQHDFNIANQTASATRSDLNNALAALVSLSSGNSEPATTFANMLWYEKDTNWLWIRNETDSAWIRIVYVNQSTARSSIQNTTSVVDTSGFEVARIGDQSNATWQAGTSTLNTLVSPARIKLAIEALGSSQPTAVGSVGTYALMRQSVTSTARSPGDTRAGSGLYYTSAEGNGSTTTASGTWQVMGAITSGVADTTNTSLWLRIS